MNAQNAVVESFFNLLKRERVRRKKYKTCEEARRDVFDHIEIFYNPQRKHVRNGMLSPVAFEQQQKLKLQGVWETRGYSGCGGAMGPSSGADRTALPEGWTEGRAPADAAGDDAAGVFSAELVCAERSDGRRFKRKAIDPVDRL